MIKKTTILFIGVLFGLSGGLFAQNVLSTHEKFHALEKDTRLTEHERIKKQWEVLESADGFVTKCITPLVSESEKTFSKKWTRNQLDKFHNRNNKSGKSGSVDSDPNQIQAVETYLSEEGNFEIEFERDGSHAVDPADENSNGIPDYVEMTAQFAEESYQKEVAEFGFVDPVAGFKPYTIKIKDTGSGTYGYTQSSGSTSFIVVNSDFSDIVSSAPNDDPEGMIIGALKVTVAHEFKHSIQYGQNSFSGESMDYAEMDATLMEEVVYDEVNDYYNYLPSRSSMFNSPETPVVDQGSYEHVSIALFFVEYFGIDFWVNVWDYLETRNFSDNYWDAVQFEIGQRGEAVESVLSKLYLWHGLSGDYAQGGFGFDEAAEYPTPDISKTITQFSQNPFYDARINRTVQPMAGEFVRVVPPSGTGNLQLFSWADAYMGQKRIARVSTTGDVTESEIALLESDQFTLSDAGGLNDTDFWLISTVNGDESQLLEYNFLMQESEQPGIYKYGDVTFDNSVNGIDVALAFDAYAGIYEFNWLTRRLGDITERSGVTLYDFYLTDKSLSGDRLEKDTDKNGYFPESSVNTISFAPDTRTDVVHVTIDSTLRENELEDGRFLVSFETESNTDFYTFQTALSYDMSVITVNDVTVNNVNLADVFYTDYRVQSGKLYLAVGSRSSLPQSLTFSVSIDKSTSTNDVDSVQVNVDHAQFDEAENLSLELDSMWIQVGDQVGVSVDEEPYHMPESPILAKTWPNPFNPETQIGITLAEASPVSISVYSIMGQHIATLTDGRRFSAGEHQISWNATGNASGTYIIKIDHPEQTIIRKVTLLR